jgi:hypothetical protein
MRPTVPIYGTAHGFTARGSGADWQDELRHENEKMLRSWNRTTGPAGQGRQPSRSA